jgi:hypothetical protein
VHVEALVNSYTADQLYSQLKDLWKFTVGRDHEYLRINLSPDQQMVMICLCPMFTRGVAGLEHT